MIGTVNKTISLDLSNFFDTQISSHKACLIKSTGPVLVIGIGLVSNISNLSDPAMTIIQGINQYLNYYKIVIPNEYVDIFFL